MLKDLKLLLTLFTQGEGGIVAGELSRGWLARGLRTSS